MKKKYGPYGAPRHMVRDKEKILRTIQEEASLDSLIKRYKLKKTKLERYLLDLGISTHKEIKVAKIRRALENGVSSMKELCDVVGLASNAIIGYCEKYDINLPFKTEYVVKTRRPEIDRLIPKGLSGSEMEAMLRGIEKKAIYMYLKGSGQQEFWKERRALAKEQARDKRFEKPRLIEQFYLCLLGRMFQLAEEKLAVEKAINYCFSIKKRKSRLEQRLNNISSYIKIFSRCEQAKKNNKKPCLEELGEGTGLWPIDVTRLLLGTEPELSHGTGEKKTYPIEIKQAIRRAYEHGLEMYTTDIAHFLRIPKYIVRNEFRKLGGRKRTHYFIKRFKHTADQKVFLTYKDASEVYEARHLGFNEDEISRVLDLDFDAVKYAVEHKDSIERKISGALEIMYPGKKHTKPFLT